MVSGVHRRNSALWPVAAIWYCTGAVELLLMGYFVGFSGRIPFACYVSYFFSLGYLLNGRLGVEWSSGMPLSDWRWVLGALVMVSMSVVPWFLSRKMLRVICYVLMIVLFMMGVGAAFFNLMGAVT